MDLFNIAASLAAIAMIALFVAGVRGLMMNSMPRLKAWLMIAVAIITAFNLYMWVSMPTPPA